MQPDSEALLQAARLEIARGEYLKAEQLAIRASDSSLSSPWARIVAGEASMRQGQYHHALQHYLKVPEGSEDFNLSAQFGAAEALVHLGSIAEAERRLRAILAKKSDYSYAQNRLAFLLNVTGRRWEATSLLLPLIRGPAGTIEHLILLGSTEHTVEDEQLLSAAGVAEPFSPWPRLGKARFELVSNRFESAKKELTQVYRKFPEEPEIQVRWGEILLGTRNFDEFAHWSRSLSPVIEGHPDLWIVRANFYAGQNDLKTSARCYWEAVRRNPNSRLGNYQLGQTLTKLGDISRAEPFLQRANLLQQLSIILSDLYFNRDHVELMGRAEILNEQLGRFWEARAWCHFALQKNPGTPWAQRALHRIQSQLKVNSPQTILDDQPIARINLTEFSLPRPQHPALQQTPQLASKTAERKTRVQFSDESQKLGVQFQFHNSPDLTTAGALITETTGGGVGILDYDCDGWPDLYLTQGAPRPPEAPNSSIQDRFYRNSQAERFIDVTSPAHLGDLEFSQGIAVGDFDNDGFPDFYLANFGTNRLYRNCGDGTFEDVTLSSGLSGSSWTTSCLCADLNGDSWPDLYDVNYCSGETVHTLLCQQNGKTRSCSPRAFDAAPDQLWLSRGDGTFQNRSQEAGILAPDGYGLGIVAADFAGTGKIDLFVANDEVPNFLFTQKDQPRENDPQFFDTALAAGVAVDSDGLSQACMGVATADADGNGMIDLFVTNFYRESNTLYLQQSPRQFSDASRTANLRNGSFEMLGFGTQFVDGDLDGWPDLVLTNGHIDDLSAAGQPYKMNPQYYRNLGEGRFEELSAEELGPFFARPCLGRGLARIDWNLDGRDDFVISHLDVPAAVVTNHTQFPGHYLALELRGQSGSRDAIGAIVQVRTTDRTQTLQMTAGDGYQASNHRQLTIGLGSQTRISELRVTWPNGQSQSWQDLGADRRLLIVEERPLPIEL